MPPFSFRLFTGRIISLSMKINSRGESMQTIIFVSIAFAFFIVCPRMAGMTHVITSHTQTNIYYVSIIGTIISIPLLLVMVSLLKNYGLIAAVGFCVLTDIAAALLMGKVVSPKAGLETFIIAIFLIAGARVAPLISSYLAVK